MFCIFFNKGDYQCWIGNDSEVGWQTSGKYGAASEALSQLVSDIGRLQL